LIGNYRYAKDALISGFENLRASSKGTAFAVARGAYKVLNANTVALAYLLPLLM
jgi:hypothetical protein